MVPASIRPLRLILRARAVIKFVLRAGSNSDNTTAEQRDPRKLVSASSNLGNLKKKPNMRASAKILRA